MSLFKWSDNLLVGIDTIDDEHQRLVALLNKLHEVVNIDSGKEYISAALTELLRYASTHFKNEEDFMQKNDYSGYGTHCKAHATFINKVVEFKTKYEKHEMVTLIPILTFLNRWITEHISLMDQKYAKEIRGKQVHLSGS